jgi:signal peptidase I
MSGQNSGPVWKSYITAVVGALLLALTIRFFFFEAYRIPTAMMRPTLEPGDVIFAVKPVFGWRFPGGTTPILRWRDPAYGEVVVFSSGASGLDSIRRVLGRQGDTVEIKHGHVLLNGHELAFQAGPVNGCGMETLGSGPGYGVCLEEPLIEDMGPEKVPPQHVFVLGDLRKQGPRTQGGAGPTRSWAMVPMDQIRAKALWVWLSIDPERSSVRGSRIFKKIQ